MSRFSNPADKLSNIASEPILTLGKGTTILKLNETCKTKLAQYVSMPASRKTTMQTFTVKGGAL